MSINTIVTPSAQVPTALPQFINETYHEFVEFMQIANESEERIGFSQDLLQNLQRYRDFQTYTDQPKTTVTFNNQSATTATYTEQTASSLTYSPVSTGDISFSGQAGTSLTYDPQERVDGSLYGEDEYSFWYYAARKLIIGRKE